MAIDSEARRNAALLDTDGMLIPDADISSAADRGAMVAWYVAVADADMVVEVNLTNLSADVDAECGVSFRLQDTSNFLAAYVDKGDSLTHLSSFTAGVEASIATAAWTPADSAEIRVIAQSNRLR